MNQKLVALQTWLNEHGAIPALDVDGKKGPRTRAAVFQVFTNKAAPAITLPQKHEICQRLGCTVRQMDAVAAVESRAGWDRKGLLTTLYERHHAFRWFQKKIPLISDPKAGGYTIDVDDDGINDSWEKVADAAMLIGERAFEFASWGKFQIMGMWWDELGYESVLEFVYSMTRSEAAHFEAFARYIEHAGLKSALKRIDGNPVNAQAFAKGYNGVAYKKYSYDTKIAAEFRKRV